MMKNYKKPPWLKVKANTSGEYRRVEDIIKRYHLNTVCQSAACPNQCECFNRKTATFMIMGGICTRNCRFCNIGNGVPDSLDADEPEKVAKASTHLKLKHCVITSVTRDDLEDGGANHFAETIRAVKKANPGIIVEVLIPDFMGREEDLGTVLNARPYILNHNIETVPRLYSQIRPQAGYLRSIALLRQVKKIRPDVYTKSGFMLGLGETREEIYAVLRDLREATCDLLTIGQYLPPSKEHAPVKEYIHPDIFKAYESMALNMGFLSVSAGPLVRSSYNAESFFIAARKNLLKNSMTHGERLNDIETGRKEIGRSSHC